MQKITAKDPEFKSEDFISKSINKLQSIFPEVFVEGKIQFDTLSQLLGGELDEKEEKYGLNWNGKRKARQVALTPSNGTLRPLIEASVNWKDTNNIFIEGDNLEVLKLLQKGYSGKVKMIYIDPPYNTGKDFVYNDNYRSGIKNYLEQTGQIENGKRIASNSETSGRYHSDWLSMIYPRLKLARSLLSQDGIIFVTLDDTEISNMRLIMDEIFGTECFVSSIVWKKRSSPDARDTIGSVHDWILVYVKNSDLIKSAIGKMPLSQERIDSYSNPDNDPRGSWASVDMTGMTGRATADQYFDVKLPSGRIVNPPEGRAWGISPGTYEQMLSDNRIWFGKSGDSVPRMKRFLSESDGQVVPSFWDMDEVGSNEEAKKEVNKLFGMADVFDTPKPVRLIRRMIEVATVKGEENIVMDFFAGSGTTGQAVMTHNSETGDNLSFILVQLPEVIDGAIKSQISAAKYCSEKNINKNIAELAKQRLRLCIAEIEGKQKGNILSPGFKAFQLTESNFKFWSASHENLRDDIVEAENNIKNDCSEDDLMFEVLLKSGIPLTIVKNVRNIATIDVINIAFGAIFLCLTKSIRTSNIEELAAGIIEWQNADGPAVRTRVFVRVNAFQSDIDFMNFILILEQSCDCSVTGL